MKIKPKKEPKQEVVMTALQKHEAEKAKRPLADLGAEGGGALSRESEITTISGVQRNSIRVEKIEVRRYRCECVLDQINAWGQITDRQWRAGIKWRFLWLRATRTGASAMRWDGSSSRTAPGGSDNPLEVKEQAVRTLNEAWEFLGPDQAALMGSVAGEDEYPRRNTERLRNALDRMADYWSIDADYCRSGTYQIGSA